MAHDRQPPRRRMRALAGTVAWLALATGVGCGRPDGCASDRDCKGDRVCEGGRCVATHTAGSAAATASATVDATGSTPAPPATASQAAPPPPAAAAAATAGQPVVHNLAPAKGNFAPTEAHARAWADDHVRTPEFTKKLAGATITANNEWQVALGDLDGDGHTDAAVDLSFTTEESNGVWEAGIAVLRNDGQRLVLLEVLTRPDIEERDGSQELDAIRDGKLLVLEHLYEEDDPRCCPSLERDVQYAWSQGKLVRQQGEPRKVDEP